MIYCILFSRVPAGVRVGNLDLSHLDTVCENWPHYSANHYNNFMKIIKYNITTGVFVTEGETEVLAAMALQTDYGGIGALQTVPKFRRLGYASIALAYQTRKMGKENISPHLHVISSNTKALELFKKTSFKTIFRSNWMVIIRSN
jgi:predicted GNAT family acetyltransferase